MTGIRQSKFTSVVLPEVNVNRTEKEQGGNPAMQYIIGCRLWKPTRLQTLWTGFDS